MRKKALIFNPYLDTLGGGEFYCFKVAEFLQSKGFETEIAWHSKKVLKQAGKRFNLALEKLRISKRAFFIFKSKRNIIQKYVFTRKYDLIFFVSDASMPFLFGKLNWLLMQAPYHNRQTQFLNQLKLRLIDKVICYSKFVKGFIDQEFKIKSQVIYPPVSSQFFETHSARGRKVFKKDNIILSVGRFDQIMNAKKQDVLVEAFKKMKDQNLKGWKLVLIGGLQRKNYYFNQLKRAVKGYPIKILCNVDFTTLKKFYQKAKIYWHAAGYEEDLTRNPQKGEHFGISVVEAMASQAVPVVFAGGGPVEIIGEENKACFWHSLDDLQQKTLRLVKSEKQRLVFAKKMAKRAQKFSLDEFFNALTKILNE